MEIASFPASPEMLIAVTLPKAKLLLTPSITTARSLAVVTLIVFTAASPVTVSVVPDRVAVPDSNCRCSSRSTAHTSDTGRRAGRRDLAGEFRR